VVLDDLLRRRHAAQVIQRDGALRPGQVAAVVAPIADALATLHNRGVVHRDVKPVNIMFDDVGTPYLGDLGTALDANAERVTTSGAVLGTIGYTAPEMVSGGVPSPASDVFSLGVLAYEALAGFRPFAGSRILALSRIRSGREMSTARCWPATHPAASTRSGAQSRPWSSRRTTATVAATGSAGMTSPRSGETASGTGRAAASGLARTGIAGTCRAAWILRMFAGVGGFGRGMALTVRTTPTGAIAAAPRRVTVLPAGSAMPTSACVAGRRRWTVDCL
jgi:hypothetical protein